MKSNFDNLIDKFKVNVPDNIKKEIDRVSDFIKKYVSENNFVIKFHNSCSTGFAGVRTRNFIIICSPQTFNNISDFIYVIFHEIQHEIQMGRLMKTNPLSGDIEDFENFFESYWELELDADTVAKEKTDFIISLLNITNEEKTKYFKISPYINNYPMMSEMIKNATRPLFYQVMEIKNSLPSDQKVDVSDLPIVKRILDKLEELF
jgi:hypothetical protein